MAGIAENSFNKYKDEKLVDNFSMILQLHLRILRSVCLVFSLWRILRSCKGEVEKHWSLVTRVSFARKIYAAKACQECRVPEHLYDSGLYRDLITISEVELCLALMQSASL